MNGFVCSTKINPVQQPVQLLLCDLHDIHFILWPGKSLLFQSFVPEAETVPIPVEDLHPICPAIAECKEIVLIWILLKFILNNPGKPIDGFSHIRRPGFQENPISFLRRWNHMTLPKFRFSLSRR